MISKNIFAFYKLLLINKNEKYLLNVSEVVKRNQTESKWLKNLNDILGLIKTGQ